MSSHLTVHTVSKKNSNSLIFLKNSCVFFKKKNLNFKGKVANTNGQEPNIKEYEKQDIKTRKPWKPTKLESRCSK